IWGCWVSPTSGATYLGNSGSILKGFCGLFLEISDLELFPGRRHDTDFVFVLESQKL
ncbi:hypothetical protein KI387_007527, partial [Taxus chinensis]